MFRKEGRSWRLYIVPARITASKYLVQHCVYNGE